VLAGTIVTMLTYLGTLPYTFWTLRGVQIGSVMEVTLLSLSLRDRYLALRTESDRVRLRIAGDLHDDIGSGLTQISLYSELAGRASEREAREWMGKVGALARDLVDRMQDIVWAIKPDDGAWESLELRMKDYAASLLAPTELAFRMEGEEVHEGVELSPDERQHVLLLFKEALHNAVRHSEGTSVQVRWRLTRHELWLRICDDGRGFRASAPRRGHGLRGMERRARELGGTMTLTTAPDEGTCIEFEVPLRSTAPHGPARRGGASSDPSPNAPSPRFGPKPATASDGDGAKTPQMRGAADAHPTYSE
jgi:signal transduction histidine kinase